MQCPCSDMSIVAHASMRRCVQWLTYWTILGGVTMTEGLVTAIVDRSALTVPMRCIVWRQRAFVTRSLERAESTLVLAGYHSTTI